MLNQEQGPGVVAESGLCLSEPHELGKLKSRVLKADHALGPTQHAGRGKSPPAGT